MADGPGSSGLEDGVIIPLFKEKGSKTDCGSYRPISLVLVPRKVLAHVLLHRLNPFLAEHRRPQQSGFTAGRSTADAILALRLFVELHSEFKCPVFVGHVDLKSAFDSVDRTALWQALKGIGIPNVILRLLQDLHADMGAHGRVGSDVSERFHTSSGVRQGCVLAPSLFCRAIDWIMSHMQFFAHVKVGDYKLTNLDYADDITLPAPTVQDVTASLSGFSEASKTLGLNVSWPKTKVQCLGTGPQALGVSIDGQQVKHVCRSVLLSWKCHRLVRETQTRYTAQDRHSEFLHELHVESMVTIEALAGHQAQNLRDLYHPDSTVWLGNVNHFKGRLGPSAGFPHADSEADARGHVAGHD